MSAVDGSVLAVYQGALARRVCGVGRVWPAVAYQLTVMAWQASWNGTVRSTARAVRLRACPVPKSCFASSIATSMAHLEAYLSMTLRAVQGRLGGDECEVEAVAGFVADQDDGHGRGAEHGVPQAGDRVDGDGLGLAVAGDRDL